MRSDILNKELGHNASVVLGIVLNVCLILAVTHGAYSVYMMIIDDTYTVMKSAVVISCMAVNSYILITYKKMNREEANVEKKAGFNLDL
jgi:fucose permease